MQPPQPYFTLRRGTKRRSAEEEQTLARELAELREFRKNAMENANTRTALLSAFATQTAHQHEQIMRQHEEHHRQLMQVLSQINYTI